MQTNIYLVRHGEVHNPKGIIYARLPRYSLSKKGIKQIEQTSNFLKNKDISAIYSSPMLRTRQTSKIIQNKLPNSKIRYLIDLMEVKTSLQGKLFADVDLVNTDYYSPPVLKPTDETMEQIGARMEKAIKMIARNNMGKNIVIVSHGDPIMILEARIKKLPMKMSSIRGIPYITHGEIIQFTTKPNDEIQTKRVFIPELSR